MTKRKFSHKVKAWLEIKGLYKIAAVVCILISTAFTIIKAYSGEPLLVLIGFIADILFITGLYYLHIQD